MIAIRERYTGRLIRIGSIEWAPVEVYQRDSSARSLRLMRAHVEEISADLPGRWRLKLRVIETGGLVWTDVNGGRAGVVDMLAGLSVREDA